jgi:hypothetical protein
VRTTFFLLALCCVVQPMGAQTSTQPASEKGASISQRCASGDADQRACSFHWKPALFQALQWTMINHTGNIVQDANVRYETFHGSYFRKYAKSVSQYQWDRFSDGDPWYINDIAHPMFGAVFGYIQIQNDPRGATLQFGGSRAYWSSRLRATAFAAAAAAQWELGPLSESAIGNTGSVAYWSKTNREWTNGTGLTDLVLTPAGGLLLMLGEDAMDKYLSGKVGGKSWLRLPLSVLTPTRSAANLMRFKAPWYRER